MLTLVASQDTLPGLLKEACQSLSMPLKLIGGSTHLDAAFCDSWLVSQRAQQLPQGLCSVRVCQAPLPDLPQLVIVLLYERLCRPSCLLCTGVSAHLDSAMRSAQTAHGAAMGCHYLGLKTRWIHVRAC